MIRETLWTGKHAGRVFCREVISWCSDLAAWRRFWHSYRCYKRLAPVERRPSLSYLYPCLRDDTAETQIEPIYFYQDTWAFEKIANKHPRAHIDVGSHYKFVAFLSKIVPTIMVDIRPLSLKMDSIRFVRGTIVDLPFEDESVESVSSLCVVEHIGLGRYGDPLDPHGTEKALDELKRVLAPGGALYISVPIDDVNRTYFNAHRSFNEDYLRQLFDPLEIMERRYIFGNSFSEQRGSGFGIGCYHLKRA